MTQDQIRAAVQDSVNREDSHDQHGVYPVRKPVLCIVCEQQPGTRGHMCDGCRDAWLEGKS